MFDEFLSRELVCYMTRVASSMSYLNCEAHIHSFMHEGRYIQAKPEPDVIIMPPHKKRKEWFVEVVCSVCKLRFNKTSDDIRELILEMNLKKECSEQKENASKISPERELPLADNRAESVP